MSSAAAPDVPSLWSQLGRLVEIQTASAASDEAARRADRMRAIDCLIRNERSAALTARDDPAGNGDALGPFDAAFARCFDIRMTSSSSGNAARSEAEARAKQLESKLQMLEAQTEVPSSVVGPVLKLLVALADTKVPAAARPETADSMAFPFKAYREQGNVDTGGLIGAPPECFDVPKVSQSGPESVPSVQKCRPYPQFTEDIFDMRAFGGLDDGSSRVSRYAAPDQSIFELKPGHGLGLLFGSKGRGEAVVRLPKEVVPPLEATLSRVDGARHLRLPLRPRLDAAAKRVADEQKDEGYHSPMSSLNPPSSGLLQACEAAGTSRMSGTSGDIWDRIWEVEVPRRRTWEALGSLQPGKERRFLTELGAAAVHDAWLVAMSNVRLMGAKIPDRPSVIGEDKLSSDIGYLMVGIASETFPYDEAARSFSMRRGACVAGVTPETLSSFCRRLIECGNACRKLESFCERSDQRRGLVFEGFVSGINKYLQGYRATVLRLATAAKQGGGSRRLLHLSKSLAKLGNQVHFLARVCKLETDSGGSAAAELLPSGVELLAHLLDRTLHITADDLYFVLVSVLRVSAAPYFRFLERWMFSGVCHDQFEEFGLRANPALLSARSRVFWTSAHVMTSPLNRDLCFGGIGGGGFIGDVQNLVYVCGKSLNLLRVCAPLHHLCRSPDAGNAAGEGVGEGGEGSGPPKIRLLVTPLEQSRLKAECAEYVADMKLTAQRDKLTLASRKEAEVEERKSALRAATRRHREQLHRLREHRKSRIEQVERKKQIAFEDLRGQMLAERQRREEEREMKAAEDAEYARLASLRAERERAREEAARREMEEEWRRKTAEAEQREERVRWRRRRMELRGKRIVFWRKENREALNVSRSGVQSQPRSPPTSAEKESNDSPKDLFVRIAVDEMSNKRLLLEDAEGNLVGSEDAGSFSELPGELETSRARVSTLPGWAREKIEALRTTGFGGGGGFVRSSAERTSGKRKRPESFVEGGGGEKRKDSGGGGVKALLAQFEGGQRELLLPSPAEDAENGNAAGLAESEYSAEYQVTAAAAVVMRRGARRRPTELVDGRKRSTASRPLSTKSIEEVLYPQRFSRASPSDVSMSSGGPVTPARTEFNIAERKQVVPYSKKFEGVKSDRVFANFATSARAMRRKRDDGGTECADQRAFTPLSLLMESSILIPLRAQLKVVNSAVVNYLLVDAKLNDHFKALRNYLLFHDGEFAQHLSTALFNEVNEEASWSAGIVSGNGNPVSSQSPNNGVVLNPATLNRIVENSVMASTFAHSDPLSANVGFEMDEKKLTKSTSNNAAAAASEALAALRLSYRAEWPANIVLTPEAVKMYGELFRFLLQLKKAVWGLDQVFVDLKALRGLEKSSPQLRQVHLMRHDMLNFITVTQNYVKNMVLDVTWEEFQAEIGNPEKVNSVDTLYEAHIRYLNKALFRCILNKKARPVHKIIIDIFNIVAKFSIVLTSRPWTKTRESHVTEVRERRRGRSETRTSAGSGGGGGGGGGGGVREGHTGRVARQRKRGRSEVRGTAAAAETAKSMSSVDQIGAEGRVSRRCREVVIATHPAFEQLSETYKYFREYSSFLYTVVHKLAMRGYQYHLYDLLLCLNYNGYYEKNSSSK